MIITINLFTVLKIYLVGVLICLVILFYMQFQYVKAYFEERKTKNVRIYWLNPKDYLVSLFSWVSLIYVFYNTLENKFEYNYYYRRLKGFFKFQKKKEVLYYYCNNKYFYKINCKKNNLEKLIYRLKKEEIDLCGFNDDYIMEILLDIKNNNRDDYHSKEILRDLFSDYKRLVINRFVRRYS